MADREEGEADRQFERSVAMPSESWMCHVRLKPKIAWRGRPELRWMVNMKKLPKHGEADEKVCSKQEGTGEADTHCNLGHWACSSIGHRRCRQKGRMVNMKLLPKHGEAVR